MATTPEEEPARIAGPGQSAEQAVLDAAADVVEDVSESELLPEAQAAMDALDNARRLLLVHAHPDDETITTGATMAHYAASGAAVTLVTCTRGERGEVIPPALSHLEGDVDALAEYRTRELAAAMEALGVSDHRFLGSDAGARFQDSGMAYDEQGRAVAAPDTSPEAFSRVAVDDAAAHLVRVLRQVRPQVVVTYEPGGGYGHPDHVHAHSVALRAVELAADPEYGDGEPWTVSRLAETVVPRSVFDSGMRRLAEQGLPTLAALGVVPSMVVPDDQVSVAVDASDQREAKAAALRAHATQVVVAGPTFALSNRLHQPLTGVEYFRIAADRGFVPGGTQPADGAQPREAERPEVGPGPHETLPPPETRPPHEAPLDDLFAGLP